MKYFIELETHTVGKETYSVEADSPEEAEKKFMDGDSEFVDEETEYSDIKNMHIYPDN